MLLQPRTTGKSFEDDLASDRQLALILIFKTFLSRGIWVWHLEWVKRSVVLTHTSVYVFPLHCKRALLYVLHSLCHRFLADSLSNARHSLSQIHRLSFPSNKSRGKRDESTQDCLRRVVVVIVGFTYLNWFKPVRRLGYASEGGVSRLGYRLFSKIEHRGDESSSGPFLFLSRSGQTDQRYQYGTGRDRIVTV